MMKYDLFKKVITERIMDFMPPIFSDYIPTIESVKKVNGRRDALILKPAEVSEAVALPMVYLDDMYEIFSIDEDMDELLGFIANVFVNYIGSISREELDVDFVQKKDQVIISLINTESNRELLSDIPHIDILNMSVIFRVIMRWEEAGFDTVIMNNSIMEKMGVEKKELYDLAVENTRRLFPPTIDNFKDGVIAVSNRGSIFGASTMIYEDVMKQLGEELGGESFYVLPSSIHQFFAISEKNADLDELLMLLANGNDHITKESDMLSNVVYSYNTSKGALRKAASYN